MVDLADPAAAAERLVNWQRPSITPDDIARHRLAWEYEEQELARAAQGIFCAEKTAVGVLAQFADHRAHRPEDGQPATDLVEMVDPHANQEHDNRAVMIVGHPLGNDGHSALPLPRY